MESFLRAEIKRTKDQLAEARRQYGDAWRAMKTASMLAGSLRELKEKIENDRSKYSYRGEQGQWQSDVEGAEQLFRKQDDVHGETISKYSAKPRVMEDLMERNEDLHWQLDRLVDGKERWAQSGEFRGLSTDDELQTRGSRSRTFYEPASGTSYRFTQTWPPPPPPSPPPRPATPPPRPKTPPPQPRTTPRSRGSPSSTEGPKRFVRPGTPPPKPQIDAWFHDLDTALADPAQVTTFPKPPHFLCAARGEACPRAALGLCACCIRDLFSHDGRMDDLKALRLKFHPDKFSRCGEGVRASVQGEAAEMFKVVDAMWRDEEARKREEWRRENERRFGPRKW